MTDPPRPRPDPASGHAANHATDHPTGRLKAGSRTRAPIALTMLTPVLEQLTFGALTLTAPNGAVFTFGDGDGPTQHIRVNTWRFARRVLAGGSLGLAESYIDGDWDTPDLAGLLSFLSRNFDALGPQLKKRPIAAAAQRLYHFLHRNSRRGARANIHAHYDLGNAFYGLWLDRTMTYSSARFTAPGQSLEHAQTEKYRTLADQLKLTGGERVLEIGSGWGGFAEYAAMERGAHVTGVTISREQYEFARKRMFNAGLNDKVDIKLIDYRDVDGAFDRVASIEMFEAVGEKYWPAYFDKIRAVLKPGGLAGLQIITIRDDLFDGYRRSVDFIQRHVFPGGMLASKARLKSEVADAGLQWRAVSSFGPDYARTLAQWRARFTRSWGDVTALSDRFDERFRRLWTYYLAYCEAGFATERTDVVQVALEKS